MIRPLIVLVIILSCASFSWAQEEVSSAPQNDFEYIKAEIGRLLVDNKKLEAEYQALKNQLDKAKVGFDAKEKQFQKIAPKELEEGRDRQQKINSLKALYQDAEKLKNEMMVKKSRTAYLTTQLIDLEDKQRLWKVKLSEMEILKRELELDIRMKEYEWNEYRRVSDAEVNEWQDNIQKSLDEERELLTRISAIEEGVYYSPAKAVELETQNDRLALRIKALEKELDFERRESQILEKKQMLAGQSKGQLILKKQMEKNELEKELQEMRRRTQQLDAILDESLDRKAQREGLLQNFVQMEQDNQKLRTQIDEIERKLNAIDN